MAGRGQATDLPPADIVGGRLITRLDRMFGTPSKAIIVGSAGQDGQLLAQLLARHGTEVVGLARGSLDLTNRQAVADLMDHHAPDSVYYLAAVHGSSEANHAIETEAELADRSVAVHVTGLVGFLQAIVDQGGKSRLFYAASSRVFGVPSAAVQDETTAIAPTETYGITKAAGLFFCRMFRHQFGVHASTGILYNHESPLRAAGYVTQKLAFAAARAALGIGSTVFVRDLETRVDWGWAEDYVEAMRRILDLPAGDDFVIASGTTHSIREFAEAAFVHVGLDWRDHVRQDDAAMAILRPQLCGSPARLTSATGWRALVTLPEIAARMVDAQFERLRKEAKPTELPSS